MEATQAAPIERTSRRPGARARLLRAASLSLTLVVAGTWFLLLRPVVFGGPASFVIVSGESMLPTLASGDLVAAFHKDSYAVGDVIVYRVPRGEPGAGTRIVHRVVRAPSSGGYVVQGDNRDGVDPWRPTDADVLGKMQLGIPRVGRLVAFLQRPPGIALVAALTTVLIALGGSIGGSRGRPASGAEEPSDRHRRGKSRVGDG